MKKYLLILFVASFSANMQAQHIFESYVPLMHDDSFYGTKYLPMNDSVILMYNGWHMYRMDYDGNFIDTTKFPHYIGRIIGYEDSVFYLCCIKGSVNNYMMDDFRIMTINANLDTTTILTISDTTANLAALYGKRIGDHFYILMTHLNNQSGGSSHLGNFVYKIDMSGNVLGKVPLPYPFSVTIWLPEEDQQGFKIFIDGNYPNNPVEMYYVDTALNLAFIDTIIPGTYQQYHNLRGIQRIDTNKICLKYNTGIAFIDNSGQILSSQDFAGTPRTMHYYQNRFYGIDLSSSNYTYLLKKYDQNLNPVDSIRFGTFDKISPKSLYRLDSTFYITSAVGAYTSDYENVYIVGTDTNFATTNSANTIFPINAPTEFCANDKLDIDVEYIGYHSDIIWLLDGDTIALNVSGVSIHVEDPGLHTIEVHSGPKSVQKQIMFKGPTADFTYEYQIGVVKFKDNSSGNVNDWTWYFGDGAYGIGQIVNHPYTSSDTFNVKLRVYDTNLCFDTIVKQVVWPYIGIDEVVVIQDIRAYPNPSDGTVFLDFDTPSQEISITIFDQYGRIVKRFNRLSGTNLQFDLPEQSGVYYLQILGAGEQACYVRLVRN